MKILRLNLTQIDFQLLVVVPVLLTRQPEERCFAEAVRVSVSEQVEAGQRGVQEETGL